jgi:DNA polymerase-1
MASSAESLSENPAPRVQLDLLGGGQVIEPKPKRTRKPRVAKAVATPTPEPPPDPEPIPDATDLVAEALAKIQHADAIGLELTRTLGKRPGPPACRKAGIDGAWGLNRWKQIKGLDPEALLADQLELAKTRAALVTEMAVGVDAAEAERASRTELTDADRTWLESRGITGLRQEAVTRIRQTSDLPPGFSGWGGKAVPCLCFRWESIDGRTCFQLRPDTPIEDEDGEVHKYLFAKGHQNVLAVPPGCRDLVLDPGVDLLICEGTKQHLAAASAMEGERLAVLGTAGCWGHRISREDQSSALVPCFQKIPLEGRRVWLLLDADRQTNRLVYDAAQDQHDGLVMLFGAAAVRFVKVPGSGTADLDDLLSQYTSQEERKKVLRRLLDNATDKQGREPNRKTAKQRPFIDMDSGKLAVADLWEALLDRHPIGVHNVGENKASLLVYRNGMFHNGKEREFENSVTVLLGNGFEPRHLSNVREFAISRLVQRGAVISARQPRLWINFRNGVLDVMTLQLEPHNPACHAFLNQVPYDWNPAAVCPYYEEWIEDRIPGQVAVYEDAISQVLDWRRETLKAPFLFGPESTGKTTALWFPRLLIGEKNMAKLSLQELGHNDFAAAELAGKLLNVCGDLERDEIRSLATFKQLTGGDGKTANKKFGDFVDLDWIGTFMFCANTIPSVSGDPGSYLKRIQPIWFRKTYTGNERPEIGERLRERSEVEGLIVRLVMALREHELRGGYLKPDQDAASHFGSRSDQVRRFLSACTITVPHKDGEEKAVILEAFDRWARDNQCGMGRNNFYSRLDSLGIQAKKVKDITGRRFPLALRDEEDWDSYDDTDPPEDPDPSSKNPEKGSESRFPLLVPTFSGPNRGSEPLAPQTVPTFPAFEGKGVSVSSGEASGLRSTEKLGGLKNREYREPLVAATDLEAKTTKQNREPKVGTDLDTPADPITIPGSTDPLVVDLETASAAELWRTPDPARPFVRLVGTDHGIGTDPAELLEHLGPLVAHNGFGFDFLALAHHHGMPLLELSEQGRLVDTLVLETLAYPNREDLEPKQYLRKLGLDAAAERRGLPGKTDDLGALAIAAAKAAGLKGTPTELKAAGFELIPQGDPKYTGYLRGDVVAGRAVFDAQCPGGQLTPYQRRELRLMGRLTHGITLMGFRIDRQEIEAREAARQQRIAGTVARLEAIGLPPRTQDKKGKWNTPHATAAGKAAIAAAFAELSITLPATATGQPQIQSDALLAIAAEHPDNPALVGLAEDVAGLVGSRSTYGNVLSYATGDRVHPQVTPLQATGRCSITKPGLTVFGKHGGKVAEREVFLPDADDHLLLAIDLSKADARAVAVWSQDPAYLDLFDSGVDINAALAQQFGIPKTLAKALGHGTRYNQQAKGMHNQTGIELAECARFLDGHRRRHSAVHRWIERVVRIGEAGRPLNNGFGRLLHTGRHTTGPRKGESKAFTQAPAYLGQSTTREWMAEGILRLPLEVAMQIRCFLHDEVVLSVPEQHLDLYREALLDAFQFSWAPPADAMVIPINGAIRSVPVVAELSPAGRTWADCYRGE